MIGFERDLVATLITTRDPAQRAEVEAYVEGTLDNMPEHVRAGVLAESLAFSVLARARRAPDLEGLVALLERSPIGVVRQYLRLFRSLVLFAEHELAAP
jgi:hypothetical protein